MKKFEYKQTQIGFFSITREANKLGQKGWQVVSYDFETGEILLMRETTKDLDDLDDDDDDDF